MIKERLYPRSIDELKAIINRYTRGVDSIACQAGHFLVYYDHTEDMLLPGIAEELDGPRHEIIKQEIGYFPELTWILGLDLLSSSAAANKYVFTIVNDWQYLPHGIDRARFYEKNANLPQGYKKNLENHDNKIRLLKPECNHNSLDTG